MRQLLRFGDLDRAKLRLAFVVYAGSNRKDMRTVTIDEVNVDLAEIQSALLPMLRTEMRPRAKDVAAWSGRLVSKCRDLLSAVLPLTSTELEFLERLNTRGEIVPELLTDCLKGNPRGERLLAPPGHRRVKLLRRWRRARCAAG